MKIFDITHAWFITEVAFPLRLLQIYVRGDAIVLVPFILLLLGIGIFAPYWGILLFAIFLVFRYLGEMIYWILQQFGEGLYRPGDFGFKKLDNKSIYVLYQLKSLVNLVLSTGFVIFLLQFLK